MKLEYYIKREWFLKYPEKALKVAMSLDEKLEAEQCILDGKILSASLMPILLNSNEFVLFQRTSEAIAALIEKTIDAIYASPRVKQYLGYEGIPPQWLDADPGYKRNIVIGRLDAIFNGKTLKYVEFNTDNPGAQAWTDVIRRIIISHPFYQKLVTAFEEDWKPTIQEKSLEMLKAIYREFRPAPNYKPSIAFVDYKDSRCMLDAMLNAEFLVKNGIQAFMADPRDFKIESGLAFVGGKRVDIVRRSLKAQELLQHQHEIKNFMQGYMDHNFCMINSFRSVYGSEKSLLALISNPEFHHLYTDEEIALIKKHIPWTRMLSEEQTQLPSQKKVVLKDFVKTHRKRLVLKPSLGYAGKSVFLGVNTTQEEWEKVVSEHIGNKDWIVQEYVPAPTINMPCIEGKKPALKKQYFTISPFIMNGMFAGLLGRISDDAIINVNMGGSILPILRY